VRTSETGPDWRYHARRARQLARRLTPPDPESPVPPALPPGFVVPVPGRGEVFTRRAEGPAGAPAILLLHGWTTTADINWWRAYERLAAHGTVLAPDHRGHGRGLRSEEPFTLEDAADDAAALLETLGLGPAVVCGYSMGGAIAVLLQHRHPHLVGGLVLEATALEWRHSWWERLVWRTMGVVERVLRSSRSRGLVERFLRESIEKCPDLAPYRAWLKGELHRGDPSAIAHAGRALGEYDGRAMAAAVDVPAAVVVTLDDHLVRPRKQRALADAIRDAQQFEIDADHDACLTSVEDFASVTEQAVLAVLAAARRSGAA
jgi:pimeloyl-ACP methyl ester carboxylesterase